MSQVEIDSYEGASIDRLSKSVLVAYALPMAGFSAATMTLTLYLLKYSADVLLIAPGAMGAVFMIARLWDAITDPVAGQLSDRTSTRWGRRRPWMVAAALWGWRSRTIITNARDSLAGGRGSALQASC
ncbi:MAG: MFS transporter [Deltaproteobacteria bacterium]|nr:MFS transporter [Deltaproteobacteria bacterium]